MVPELQEVTPGWNGGRWDVKGKGSCREQGWTLEQGVGRAHTGLQVQQAPPPAIHPHSSLPVQGACRPRAAAPRTPAAACRWTRDLE